MQLHVNIASHPLIQHWSGILENKNTPGTIIRTACLELSKWLTYEIMREWLNTETIEIETLETKTKINVISNNNKYIIVIIMPYGFILAEGARSLLPTASIALVNCKNSISNLPNHLNSFTKILILDLFLDETIISSVLKELTNKGVLLKNTKIACLECAPFQLNHLGNSWSELEIFTTKVNNIIDGKESTKEKFFKDNFFI